MKNETALKWLKQALHDLDMAEKNIAIGGYDVTAFLAHQSVEKLLKAIFIIRGAKVPRTHYIDELARKLKLDEEIVSSALGLAVDYTFSRYPDVAEHVPYEEYNEEIAREKVETAKEIFESLKDLYEALLEGENG